VEKVKIMIRKIGRGVIQGIGTASLQDKDCKRFSKMQAFGEIIVNC